MIRLIASDLDGTIIDNNNKICQKNLEAINFINSQNIPFVICTGKTYSVYRGICRELKADYGILGNGSLLVNLKTGKTIYENLLNKDEIIKLIEFAKSKNLHIHLYTDKQIISEKLLYLDLRNYKLQEKNLSGNFLDFQIVPNLLDYIINNNLKIFNVVISSESKLNNFKNAILKELDVNILHINKTGEYKDFYINKEYEYLSILKSNTNKNIALKILCENLQFSMKDVLAIGDNLNDVDMIKNSGIGVAMQNAYCELKNVSDYITSSSVQEGGFAEAIYKFLKIE